MKQLVRILTVLAIFCIMAAFMVWGGIGRSSGQKGVIAIPIEYGEPPPIVLITP